MIHHILRTIDMRVPMSAIVSAGGAIVAFSEKFLPVVQFIAGCIGIIAGIVSLALGVRAICKAIHEDFPKKNK